MPENLPIYIGAGAGIIVLGLLVVFSLWAMSRRVVVPTNEVDIVQSKGDSIDYGRGRKTGNVYYNWPAFMPVIGVVVSRFPESIFSVELMNYEGYDKGRVPFRVDIMAFFRVDNAPLAAQRVESFTELENQLRNIVRGAVRSVLGNDTLENIMQDRSGLGAKFTEEVSSGLTEWGVILTRHIEFMDIRDSDGSVVIRNIMAKEQSRIDQESRVIVAENSRVAKEQEIEADRLVKEREQEARRTIGIRTAEADKQIGIADEQSRQEILTQSAETTTREMAVRQIEDVRKAEIAKAVAAVSAEQDREVTVINAEAGQRETVIKADADRDAAIREAEAIKAIGAAKADAEYLILQAPVKTQLELADGIGANQSYQDYLIRDRQVQANEKVGVEMAGALGKADVKMIINDGTVQGSTDRALGIFSPGGGTSLGGMLEGFAQTEQGKAVIDHFLKTGTAPTSPAAPTSRRAKNTPPTE